MGLILDESVVLLQASHNNQKHEPWALIPDDLHMTRDVIQAHVFNIECWLTVAIFLIGEDLN